MALASEVRPQCENRVASTGSRPEIERLIRTSRPLLTAAARSVLAMLPRGGWPRDIAALVITGRLILIDACPPLPRMSVVPRRPIVEAPVAAAPTPATPMPPTPTGPADISGQFSFGEDTRGGDTIRWAAGFLGRPGEVVNHRNAAPNVAKRQQSDVSAGTGDNAGHLIGIQFGPPNTSDNLGRQNWRQNQGPRPNTPDFGGTGPGTYYATEMQLADELAADPALQVHLEVREVTPAGSDRPTYREVTITRSRPGQPPTTQEIVFANTHTPESREQSGNAAPSEAQLAQDGTPDSEPGELIPVDFVNKRRL